MNAMALEGVLRSEATGRSIVDRAQLVNPLIRLLKMVKAAVIVRPRVDMGTKSKTCLSIIIISLEPG